MQRNYTFHSPRPLAMLVIECETAHIQKLRKDSLHYSYYSYYYTILQEYLFLNMTSDMSLEEK